MGPQFLGPKFLGVKDPKILTVVCYCGYILTYGKVWLSSVIKCMCEAGNEEKRRIFGGWVKNSGLILIHLWTKVHIILRHVGNPLYCSLSLQRTCPIVYVIRR